MPLIGSISKSGRAALSWAVRRGLLVPRRAPVGSSFEWRVPAVHQNIARVLSLGVSAYDKTGRHYRGHVLRAMHRYINLAVEQRGFDFLDEHPALHAEQRRGFVSVAARGQRHELDVERRVFLQQQAHDFIRLRQRKGTRPRADDDPPCDSHDAVSGSRAPRRRAPSSLPTSCTRPARSRTPRPSSGRR